MPKRSSKDINETAFSVVQKATQEPESIPTVAINALSALPVPPSGKNPAAVALGRLGGLKGGKARAKKLSDDRMREIARQGAMARWKKKRSAEN
jgi:hypothetical protein